MEKVIKITGELRTIVATPDRTEVMADRQSDFVTVTVNDREGLIVFTADNRLEFQVEVREK